MKKRIGIITGAGPEAGIDLWQKILEENRRLLGADFQGDLDAPEVVIHSLPTLGLAMNLRQHEETLWLALEASLRQMAGTVDLVCIACNVLHVFAERIRALELDLELVSIVDTAREHIVGHALERVGLLSISSVMNLDGLSPYAPLRESADVVTSPRPQDMDELVRAVKRYGAEAPGLRQRYAELVSELGVSQVILACTELPLLARALPGIEQLDATRLLARALVQKSLA